MEYIKSIDWINVISIFVQIIIVLVMCSALRESVRSRRMGQLPIIVPALFFNTNIQGKAKLEVKNVGSGPALNVQISLKKDQNKSTLLGFNVVGIRQGEFTMINIPPFSPNISITEPLPYTFEVTYLDVYGKKYKLEIDYKADGSSEVRFITGFKDYQT